MCRNFSCLLKAKIKFSYPIEKIRKSLDPLHLQIIQHKIYAVIEQIEDLKIFIQYHVYAVWDFMSLLKTLQNNLTCTQVPWFPKGSAETLQLINEIVVGEESDVDEYGPKKATMNCIWRQ